MAAREWLAPLALGAAAFLALWLWDPAEAPPPEPVTPEQVPLRFPFPAGPAVPADCVAPAAACGPAVLAIAGGNTTAQQVGAAMRLGPGDVVVPVLPAPDAVSWQTGQVGILPTARGLALCGPAGCQVHAGPALQRLVPADAPRLGDDGTWAASFTFYAFRPDGKLLASNAPDPDVLRFTLDGDYTQLPRATYWLGDGPAPAGAQPLPEAARGLVRELRGNLTGLPEGGVATRLLERYPYSDIFGPLWVTARIDRLAPAGPA